MPFINPEDGYLTVLNLFKTDSWDRVDSLVKEMSRIVDTADYPGWISSTVHRGDHTPGTLNFIQWRGMEDLETRYRGDEFKHHTIPVFKEITTYVRLMQTEMESSLRHPSLGEATEVSPSRDDYTVVEILGVEPSDQRDLVAAQVAAHEWLVDEAGYRSQSVFRGIRSRNLEGKDGELKAVGTENDFVIVYTQWDSKESYEAFRTQADGERSAARRETDAKKDALITVADWNAYRPVHTRSAPESAAA